MLFRSMCIILVGMTVMADLAARGFDARPPRSEANEGEYEAAGERTESTTAQGAADVPGGVDARDEEG